MSFLSKFPRLRIHEAHHNSQSLKWNACASIVIELHRTIFEKKVGGGASLPQPPPQVGEELLARTYEVGVTILATLGGGGVFGGRCGARRKP